MAVDHFVPSAPLARDSSAIGDIPVKTSSCAVMKPGALARKARTARPPATRACRRSAAAGRASPPPPAPRSEAPANAAPNATAGWSSIVRAVMRGAKK